MATIKMFYSVITSKITHQGCIHYNENNEQKLINNSRKHNQSDINSSYYSLVNKFDEQNYLNMRRYSIITTNYLIICYKIIVLFVLKYF